MKKKIAIVSKKMILGGIEKVLISPKINFNSLSSNMVGNNELLALQAEKKQLFEASNNIFGSTGLTQNEMNNLRMISSEIKKRNGKKEK